MAHCPHVPARASTDRCFSGSVSRDQNRAAHGCITYTEECLLCGARRAVNQNQGHFEQGDWGPTRQQRRTHARELERQARQDITSLLPLVFERAGRRATVRLDMDGLISVAGAEWSEILPALTRTEWLRRARSARQALVEAEHARGEV